MNFSFAFFPSAFYQLGPRSQPECTRGTVTEVRLRLLITEVQFLNFIFETSSISQSSIKWGGGGGVLIRGRPLVGMGTKQCRAYLRPGTYQRTFCMLF